MHRTDRSVSSTVGSGRRSGDGRGGTVVGCTRTNGPHSPSPRTSAACSRRRRPSRTGSTTRSSIAGSAKVAGKGSTAACTSFTQDHCHGSPEHRQRCCTAGPTQHSAMTRRRGCTDSSRAPDRLEVCLPHARRVASSAGLAVHRTRAVPPVIGTPSRVAVVPTVVDLLARSASRRRMPGSHCSARPPDAAWHWAPCFRRSLAAPPCRAGPWHCELLAAVGDGIESPPRAPLPPARRAAPRPATLRAPGTPRRGRHGHPRRLPVRAVGGARRAGTARWRTPGARGDRDVWRGRTRC